MSAVTLLLGLVPVVLFLAALVLMDSYKLVSRRAVFLALAAGGLSAVLSFLVNRFLLASSLEAGLLRHAVGPLVEEAVKAAYLVALIRTARVGFLVDAGILGFAVGAGFALVENLYYAAAVGNTDLGLWMVRGLGTAVMHGSTTAIVGILSKSLTDRRGSTSPLLFVPGIALAAVLHALFNNVIVNPVVSTMTILIAMPLLVGLVFRSSDQAMRDWLNASLDSDVEMLQSIESGQVEETPFGQFLSSLKRLPGPVVADMLCLVRIHLELSLRAKGLLIAREAGVELPVDDSVREDFRELHYLERSIGRAGRIAIQPYLRHSSRDLWQLHMLEG